MPRALAFACSLLVILAPRATPGELTVVMQDPGGSGARAGAPVRLSIDRRRLPGVQTKRVREWSGIEWKRSISRSINELFWPFYYFCLYFKPGIMQFFTFLFPPKGCPWLSRNWR